MCHKYATIIAEGYFDGENIERRLFSISKDGRSAYLQLSSLRDYATKTAMEALEKCMEDFTGDGVTTINESENALNACRDCEYEKPMIVQILTASGFITRTKKKSKQ